MTLRLSSQQQRELLDLAKNAGDFECCGLLLGQGNVVEKIELTANVAADPTIAFEIDAAALILAEKRARQGGPKILGYFHSHPNGNSGPSAKDLLSAAADGKIWLIIANGKISGWVPVVGKGGSPKIFGAISIVEG